MRKIIINGEFFAEKKPVGITRYSYELVKELDKIAPHERIEILAPICDFDTSEFKNIRFRELGTLGNNKEQRKKYTRIWKYIIYPLYCRVNNGFSFTTGLTWKHYCFDAFAIHDCIPELFSDFFPKGYVDTLIRKQRANCKKCKFILTVSNRSKEDISAMYGISSKKIYVIPNAWQHFKEVKEDETILDKLGLRDREFFFSLGSRFPHKNVKWIGFAAKKHPQYTFVITGSRLGKTDTSFEGEIPGNMFFTGYLKDEEIKSLMRHCKAFIQPSFYEGFGIPPMEAMSVGADCIVSNAGALPEIYKKSVWYIDPYDYKNINLDEIMSRPKESNDLILNEYSWEKSAKMLWDVLQKMDCREG